MKILIVSHYFLPHVGGIEIVAYNQAKELVKLGHDVTIVSSRIGSESERETMDGIQVIRVKAWNFFEKHYGIPYPVYHPNLLSVLNKEVKRADLVYVHECFYISAFVGTIFSRLYTKPLFLMQHVEKVNTGRKIVTLIQEIVYATYGKFVLNSAKKIIVCNKNAGDSLNRKEKTFFIRNGVDINLFKPVLKSYKLKLRKKYNLPTNKKIILFTGRFVKKKGFDKLFEAKSKDYLILFVGEGNVPEYMRRDNNVKFMPFLTQERLSEIYCLSDIFVLPSVNEGFPLTILEAMACGLPIITTDHKGYDTYLDRRYVSLIEPKSELIKKEINRLIKNDSLSKKMAQYSRKQAVERFSWELNSRELVKIYDLDKK